MQEVRRHRGVAVRGDVVVQRHGHGDQALGLADEQGGVVAVREADRGDAGLPGGPGPAVVTTSASTLPSSASASSADGSASGVGSETVCGSFR